MVITRPFYGVPTVECIMMAGAKSRRDVGWRHEFPMAFRAQKRKALLLMGAYLGLNMLSMMASPDASMMPFVVLDFLLVAPIILIMAYLVFSNVPIAIGQGWVNLKGVTFKSDSIARMDIFIPNGRPGAKAHRLKFVFTVNGPKGQFLNEVKVIAQTYDVIHLLSEARARLPFALICDHSGLLPAHLWCPPREGRPQDSTSAGPLQDSPGQQQRRLRISPADGDWVYPARLAPAREVALGHRGESHLDHLRRAPASNARVRIQCPPVIAVWC